MCTAAIRKISFSRSWARRTYEREDGALEGSPLLPTLYPALPMPLPPCPDHPGQVPGPCLIHSPGGGHHTCACQAFLSPPCPLLALVRRCVARRGLASLVPLLRLCVFLYLIKATPGAPLAHSAFYARVRKSLPPARAPRRFQHRFGELPSCSSSTPRLPSQVIREPGALGAVPCGCSWLIPRPSLPSWVLCPRHRPPPTGRPGEHLSGLHEGPGRAVTLLGLWARAREMRAWMGRPVVTELAAAPTPVSRCSQIPLDPQCCQLRGWMPAAENARRTCGLLQESPLERQFSFDR